MPKGGARIRSGPAPDPNALHRDRDDKDWISLPAAGRQGDIPRWPLTKATIREREMWEEIWTRPQAIIWEHQRQFDEVALYVRKFVEASKPKASANLTTAVRQMADSLGLTVPGMLRNKWRIGGVQTEVSQPRQQPTVSSRDRFRVVDGSG